MTDKPKRLEDVTISVNLKPLELDEEAMCEAIKYQIQQELFEWQRTTTKIPYDDGPFKGLLGKSLRKAFASAIGVDDNGQCLLTEMEHRASGSTLDKLAALVCVERKPGESDDSLRRRWLGERAGVDPFGPGPDLPSEHEEPEVQHQTITFKSHDQWARPQEEEVVVPKDWVVTADLQLINTGLMTYHRITATPGTPFKLSEYEEPRWSFPVLPGLTPAEPAVAMATWSEPITWTTGPGKQTARNGDREARLTKGGLYWYAEGHVDLQWGAVSLGASRDVVELKQAAMAWLKGDAEWERHQRDLGFVAVYDETLAEEKETEMREIALDTLRQPAKK